MVRQSIKRTREVVAKLKRPVKKKTLHVPVISVVTNAVRQDVLMRLNRSLHRRMNIPGPRAMLSLPGIREHAFAKEFRERPIDISGKKTRSAVWTKRELHKGEDFFIHTHPTSPIPSLNDLAEFVRRVMKNKKVSDVIYVLDSQRAEATFNRAVSRRLYYRTSKEGLVPKKIPRVTAEQVIWTEATRAVEQINVVARVFMTPTKTLLKMPPKQAHALVSFLERKAEISSRAESESFGRITNNAEKHLARTWGRLFKLQYKSMPGYKYDGKSKNYVKV